MPQTPQLDGLLDVSTQMPAHSVCPFGQLPITQALFWQIWPTAQAWLQAPQCRALAATLVQAGRHSELPPFFSEQLQAVRQSKLSAEEQKNRILALRHGMVEAQVVLKDFTAALDQYIEMINTGAEDAAPGVLCQTRRA